MYMYMYMNDNARQMHAPKAASDFQRNKTELPWANFEFVMSRVLDVPTELPRQLSWMSRIQRQGNARQLHVYVKPDKQVNSNLVLVERPW